MSSASSQNLAESAIHARIRDKLNAEKIHLWLAPFYDETEQTVNDTEILALSNRYTLELEMPQEDVSECIYSLQRNAIERLAERQAFQSTGIATVRLRFSGFKGDAIKDNMNNRIQVFLGQTTGKQLKEKIAQTIKVPENGLKLICLGKVVDDSRSLDIQNVKNGSQVMVLSVTSDSDVGTLHEAEDQFKDLEETINSANYLSTHDGTDGLYSLQVADQSGKSLDLPDSEKRALTLALTLHAKGRSFMKSQHFSKALVYLLESDVVYSRCESSILDMVDNYGLLNLDVGWCYLSLQSIAELPQVETRLNRCERALKRSYGEDMERVIALKGSSGWEAALYVRLHLLQAITSYHLGQIEKARFYLNQAEAELGRLKISDESLVALINMGYAENDARMALRSCYGDLDRAVDWIIRKQEERQLIKQQEKEDLKRRKLQKKLGTCLNGDLVSIPLYRQMKEMGYSSYLVSEALKRTNNDTIQSLTLMGNSTFESEVMSNMVNQMAQQPSTSSNLPSQLAAAVANIPNLAGLSLNEEAIAQAIKQMTENPESNNAEALRQLQTMLNQSFSEEQLLASRTPSVSEEDIQRSKKAYDTLVDDIQEDSEYIDLSLEPENNYVQQYKTLLSSLG